MRQCVGCPRRSHQDNACQLLLHNFQSRPGPGRARGQNSSMYATPGTLSARRSPPGRADSCRAARPDLSPGRSGATDHDSIGPRAASGVAGDGGRAAAGQRGRGAASSTKILSPALAAPATATSIGWTRRAAAAARRPPASPRRSARRCARLQLVAGGVEHVREHPHLVEPGRVGQPDEGEAGAARRLALVDRRDRAGDPGDDAPPPAACRTSSAWVSTPRGAAPAHSRRAGGRTGRSRSPAAPAPAAPSATSPRAAAAAARAARRRLAEQADLRRGALLVRGGGLGHQRLERSRTPCAGSSRARRARRRAPASRAPACRPGAGRRAPRSRRARRTARRRRGPR